MLEQLADVPDMRAWSVNDRGERAAGVRRLGSDGRGARRQSRTTGSAMRRDRGLRERHLQCAALDRPEIRVTPDLDEAGRARRLDGQRSSETVRVATIGDIDANLAKFNAGDRQIPIRVQLTESARATISRLLEHLPVRHARPAARVPLSSVADIALRPGAVLDRPLRPRAPGR